RRERRPRVARRDAGPAGDRTGALHDARRPHPGAARRGAARAARAGAARAARGAGVNRRQLLGGGLASLLLVPRLAHAFGEASLVDVAELDLGAGTIRRPDAWRRLLYEITLTTSVACGRSPVTVAPDSPALFEHPFTVLVGDGAF